MNYFECVAANHGGGSSNTITVTCDSGFAGVTLTCTDGNDTYTKVCPSVSPFTVDFENLAAGDWTISGTVQGTSYSNVVSISDSYATTLESGFSWATWVDLSQNYHSADYNSLSDVFADEGALYELMTIHACCDYLIDAVNDDVDVIDDFCANDTAMKWIGLRDYVCDGLTAINGVEAKFLASQYWERYLKDHVPTMTANNAPYGVATSKDNGSGALAPYTSFDGVITSTSASYGAPAGNTKTSWWGFQFTNPICVKKAIFYAWISLASKTLTVSAKIQGSNDGTNWTDIGTAQTFTINGQDLTPHEVNVPSNADYYLYKRLELSSDDYLGVQGSYATHITSLQFYGRSLNVSVPIMTSNTTPFGECNGNFDDVAYKAFDGATTTQGTATILTQPKYLGYTFPSKVCVKAVEISEINNRTNYRPWHMQLKGSDDGFTTESLITSLVGSNNVVSELLMVNNSNSYKGFRLYIQDAYNGTSTSSTSTNYCNLDCLQFYGVDYSEREFEPNSGKKWLYDHGLELEAITTSGTVTKGSNYLTLSAANSEATATVDLTNYSILRGKVGDHMSGTTQLSVGGSNPAAATLTSDNAPNNNSLDISSLSQTLATGVKMTANGICDITELWVE